MIEILEFIIIFTLSLTVLIWLIFVIGRLRLLISLLSIRKIEGAKLKITSPPALFLPVTRRKPAAKIKVRDKVFSVYLYHGGGRTKFVHIANEKYSVVYSRFGGLTPRGASRTLGAKKTVLITLKTGVSRAKVKLLPRIEAEGEIPILLFSPEPAELTYVTKEKSSIKIAFTGEEVGAFRIFTKDTLLRYIDRESRGFFDKITK